jgi:hypothetical protein
MVNNVERIKRFDMDCFLSRSLFVTHISDIEVTLRNTQAEKVAEGIDRGLVVSDTYYIIHTIKSICRIIQKECIQ